MIFDARSTLNTPLIIGGMIILGTLWVLIDELIVKRLEYLTIRRWGMVHR